MKTLFKLLTILCVLWVMVSCGDEKDSCKSVDYICKACTKDGDCCGNTCATLYDVYTGYPVGKYCIDTVDRVCSLK